MAHDSVFEDAVACAERIGTPSSWAVKVKPWLPTCASTVFGENVNTPVAGLPEVFSDKRRPGYGSTRRFPSPER